MGPVGVTTGGGGLTQAEADALYAPLSHTHSAADIISGTLDDARLSANVVLLTASQTLTNKTLTTPTIGSFVNANHNHQNAAGGGTLDAAAIGSGTLANARINWAAPSDIGGTTAPAATLNDLIIRVNDANNASVVNMLELYHNTTGTPTAGLGSAITFGGEVTSFTDIIGARLRQTFTNISDASNTSSLIASIFNAGVESDIVTINRFGLGVFTTPGSSFVLDVTGAVRFSAGLQIASSNWITAAGQNMIQRNGSAGTQLAPAGGLGIALSDGTNTILFADASTQFVGIGTGTGDPSAKLHVLNASAANNAVDNVVVIGNNAVGAAAAGFGGGLLFQLESSTTNNQNAALIETLWNSPTHASSIADMVLSAYNAGTKREAIRIRGNTAAQIGFLGATPASQQTGGAQTAGAAYGATEQDMLQKAYNALRTFGFLN